MDEPSRHLGESNAKRPSEDYSHPSAPSPKRRATNENQPLTCDKISPINTLCSNSIASLTQLLSANEIVRLFIAGSLNLNKKLVYEVRNFRLEIRDSPDRNFKHPWASIVSKFPKLSSFSVHTSSWTRTEMALKLGRLPSTLKSLDVGTKALPKTVLAALGRLKHLESINLECATLPPSMIVPMFEQIANNQSLTKLCIRVSSFMPHKPNRPLSLSILPPNLTDLELDRNITFTFRDESEQYPQPLVALPQFLKSLFIFSNNDHDHPFDALPTGLTRLVFLRSTYRVKVADMLKLPRGLRYLSSDFTLPEQRELNDDFMVALPNMLRTLRFGSPLPANLLHLLPTSITNTPLPKQVLNYQSAETGNVIYHLPPRITALENSNSLAYDIDIPLPPNLRFLDFGRTRIYELVEYHQVSSVNLLAQIQHLPLEKLTLSEPNQPLEFITLPSTLVHLKVYLSFGESLHAFLGRLPPNLQYLSLRNEESRLRRCQEGRGGCLSPASARKWPTSLLTLDLDFVSTSRILSQSHLPNLTSLTLAVIELDPRLALHLPLSLQKLDISTRAIRQQSTDDDGLEIEYSVFVKRLPPSLTSHSISFQNRQNMKVTGDFNIFDEDFASLPRTMVHLVLPHSQHLTIAALLHLPSSLITLRIGELIPRWFGGRLLKIAPDDNVVHG